MLSFSGIRVRLLFQGFVLSCYHEDSCPAFVLSSISRIRVRLLLYGCMFSCYLEDSCGFKYFVSICFLGDSCLSVVSGNRLWLLSRRLMRVRCYMNSCPCGFRVPLLQGFVFGDGFGGSSLFSFGLGDSCSAGLGIRVCFVLVFVLVCCLRDSNWLAQETNSRNLLMVFV